MQSHNANERFLKIPYRLLDRWKRAGLTGVEYDCLLSICRWTYGFQTKTDRGYKHRSECRGGLTGLSNEIARSRQGVAKALEKLQAKSLINKTKESDWRHPSQYMIVDESTTVDSQPPLTHGMVPAEGKNWESQGSVSTTADRLSTTVDRVSATVDSGVSTAVDTRKNIFFKKESGAHENFERAPLKVPQGDIVRSAEKRTPDRSSFLKDLKSSTLSGDSVPLPGNGTPLNQKPNPQPLIDLFEETTGLTVHLTKTEFREFGMLMEGCNQSLYQSAFMKLVLKVHGKPIPDQLKRPGDLCMMIAKAAANQTHG
jgi:hypothetical protein